MNRLYKYYPIEKFTLKSINNHEIFFSNPLNFNDPFEIEYQVEIKKLPEEELVCYFNENSKNQNFLKLHNNDLRAAEQSQFNLYLELGYKNSPFLKDVVVGQTGISCFSKLNNNFLMWSHYADKHRGICLGFNRGKLNNVIDIIEDVTYEPTLPKIYASITDMGNTDENLAKIITTKLIHWKKEEEVRAIILLDGVEKEDRIFPYSPDILETIIFGCKMQDEDKELIINIVKMNEKYNHVVFQDAILDKQTSALTIEKLNFNKHLNIF